jgi:hypothetical protein
MSHYDRYKKFVQEWQMSKSLNEFCEKSGVDKRYASNLAAHLRRRGVKLKTFCRRDHEVRKDPYLTVDEWSSLQEAANVWIGVWKKSHRTEVMG